ncbi:MAG: hypothetical protein ACFHWZ_16145 [Phycisphaerales bacterium]
MLEHAVRRRGTGSQNRREVSPSSPIVTISPGSTSRMNSAPTTSSAIVSLVMMYGRRPVSSSGRRPITSGASPRDRAASMRSLPSSRMLNAPSNWARASASGSSDPSCELMAAIN